MLQGKETLPTHQATLYQTNLCFMVDVESHKTNLSSSNFEIDENYDQL